MWIHRKNVSKQELAYFNYQTSHSLGARMWFLCLRVARKGMKGKWSGFFENNKSCHFELTHFFLRSAVQGGDWWSVFFANCVTQLKLDTGEKLSSTIFCCLCVSEASVSPDQISTFSNIYRHTSPLLTQYNLILSSTELYWPSTTMYQPVPPCTDPVLPSTNQYQYQPVDDQFPIIIPVLKENNITRSRRDR